MVDGEHGAHADARTALPVHDVHDPDTVLGGREREPACSPSILDHVHDRLIESLHLRHVALGPGAGRRYRLADHRDLHRSDEHSDRDMVHFP